MRIRSFGKLRDGTKAGLYILSNSNGMQAHLTDYGAALVRLYVPDKDDKLRDVVLGYDDAAGYEEGSSHFGATVGRVANRISTASFDLNGRHYILTANDGPNTLHGGRDFYSKRMWSPVISFGKVSSGDIAAAYAVESMNDWSREPRGRNKGQADGEISGSDSITFTLDSPDGDQGFPGNLRVEVTYTLTEANELHIDYFAQLRTDITGAIIPATPINLTNHSYFNLNGHDSGTVLDHEVRIDADMFTEADSRSIPTGRLLNVRWTPMDFRKAKPLGKEIEADYEPLHFGCGYDHNYVLSTEQTGYREVAEMYSEDSGIRMTVMTDLPGMQLYTANYLDSEPGKGGAVYESRSAACFETQFWPDTINKEKFPGGVLTAGDEFRSRTTYSFSIRQQETM